MTICKLVLLFQINLFSNSLWKLKEQKTNPPATDNLFYVNQCYNNKEREELSKNLAEKWFESRGKRHTRIDVLISAN